MVRIAVLLIAVLVLTTCLPLLAVYWSRARYLRRPAVLSWIDLLHIEARRQHLTLSQIDSVARAVNSGQPAPPGLQPLAAQLAAARVDVLERSTKLGGRARLALLVVATLSLILAIVLSMLRRDPTAGLVPGLEAGLAVGLVRVGWRRQLRRARQAVDANRVPTKSSD